MDNTFKFFSIVKSCGFCKLLGGLIIISFNLWILRSGTLGLIWKSWLITKEFFVLVLLLRLFFICFLFWFCSFSGGLKCDPFFLISMLLKKKLKALSSIYFMLFGHKRGRTENRAKADYLGTNANFQHILSENNSFTHSDFSVTSLWWTTQVSSIGGKNNTIGKVSFWGLRFSGNITEIIREAHQRGHG